MTLDDTILDQLAAQVRAHPPLPLAEVDRLLAGARRSSTGSERDTLVCHHMSVALDTALARRGREDDVAELFQEAGVAVVAAVNDYAAGDGDAGGLLACVRSATAAQVEGVLRHERELREEAEALVRDTRMLDVAQVGLRAKLGRDATSAELAGVLEWAPERVDLLIAILADARRLNDETLIPFLEDAEEEQPGD